MFREMRRKNQELPREECLAILETATSGVLAVSGDGGYPYAVPLSFVWHEGNIYFHCAQTGHKLDSIARNPLVSFCVIAQDDVLPEKFTTRFRSVIVFGQARVLKAGEEMRTALTWLAEKYSPEQPGLLEEVESHLGRVCVVEIPAEHITGKEAAELMRERSAGEAPKL